MHSSKQSILLPTGTSYWISNIKAKLSHKQCSPCCSRPIVLNYCTVDISTWTNISGAGNSLICFPCESLVVCPKMSKWAICSKQQAIRSYLVSDLSDSLTIDHFLWATWGNRSWSLIFGERLERFAHIAHFWWAAWAIRSQCSLKKREWANR